VSSLTIDGFLLRQDRFGEVVSISSDTLVMNFANNVNSVTYRYINSQTVEIISAGPISARLDGLNVLQSELDAFELNWGSGETTFFVLFAGTAREPISFVMPVGGTAIPDFDVRGGLDLWVEFNQLPIETEQLDSGAFRPRQSISFSELEDPSFSSDVRQGNQTANTINGSARDNILVGMGGNDRLFGGGGDDTMLSGTGNDVARGGGGDDYLLGFKGDDRLFGDGGEDHLNGGEGRNTLSGGAGEDDFVFLGAGSEVTIIKDFRSGDELLLDRTLWDEGTLTARQIVDQFGSVENGRVELEFESSGGTTRIVIENLNSLSGLFRSIDIIDFA
jgi:Ca2+-binding RTX toxin-like protein